MISGKRYRNYRKIWKKQYQELIVELHNLYLKRYVEKDTDNENRQSKHKFCLDYMTGSKIKEKNVYPLVQYQK